MAVVYSKVGGAVGPFRGQLGAYFPQVTGLSAGGYAVSWIGPDNDRSVYGADLLGRVFTASSAPTSASDLILVRDVAPGPQLPVLFSMAQASGGGFVQSWFDNSRSADPNTDLARNIAVRFFDASGAASPSTLLLDTLGGSVSKIVNLNDGRYLVSWDGRQGSVANGGFFQMIDSEGRLLGDRTSIPTYAVREGQNTTYYSFSDSMFDVAPLRSGGFMVSYSDGSRAPGTSSPDVYVNTYDALGRTLVAHVRVSTPSVGLGVESKVAGLAQGNAVVIWATDSIKPSVLTAQIVDPLGNRIGASFTIAAAGQNASIAPLADGGFSVAWNDQTSGSVLRIYDGSGTPNGSLIVLAPADRTFTDPTVSALASGGFVASWSEGTGIFAQPFSVVVSGLTGTANPERIIGGASNDLLTGLAGSDTLFGGAGDDTLDGGAGDDLLIVDDTGDRVLEAAGGGTDTLLVRAANYLLNGGAEIELLRAEAGTAPINIGGNGFSQRIEGNDGANILSSGGGGGVDTMAGGLGDDTYRVFATGDVIEDTGGFDTLYASGTSYFLYATAAVEYLSTSEQAATTPIYLVGNGASQVIAGNWGDNIINGRGGDGVALPDTLIGLYGNDTYGVFSQGDVVREVAGQGNDVVYASTSYQLRNGTEIEALAAINGTAVDAYTLRGNEFAQTVVGNAGANTLDGRGGNDTLIGLAGADVFAFTRPLGSGNVDTIQDFAAEDRIGLATDIFAAVTAGGITAGEFVAGTTAQDADDRLLYDQATGRLFYDADANGAGAAVLFAQLAAGTALNVTSFVAVASVSDLPGA